MAKFNKIDTISIIRSTGIVPVFYNKDAALTKKVVKACYDGGIRAFEFTNRGDGAHKVFEELIAFVRENCPEMEAIIEEYRESHPKDTEPFHPFEERYPEVDPITYDKPVRDNHRHPATKKHRKR